jgi:alpha-glucosidase
MQNGSLGRRLNVEVRAYDDGVAFRYIVPRSTALEELVIHDEATEFAFPQAVPSPVDMLPFAVRQPAGWVEITEIAEPGFPPMHLIQSSQSILTARLAKKKSDPDVAWEGASPLTWPWRVVVIGLDRDHLAQSTILSDLQAAQPAGSK